MWSEDNPQAIDVSPFHKIDTYMQLRRWYHNRSLLFGSGVGLRLQLQQQIYFKKLVKSWTWLANALNIDKLFQQPFGN